MISKRMRRPGTLGLLLGLLLAGTAAPGAGQSVLSAYGFGVPMEPLDGRALALGGIGLGLPGSTLSGYDPTSGAGLVLPAGTFTSQTSWNAAAEDGTASSSTVSRFPSMGILYPVRRVGTLSVSLSGILDQSYRISQERTINLEGTNTEARVTDTFASDGGVSVLRVGVARRIGNGLAVGVTAGTYIGNVNRQFVRSFDSLEVETEVPPFGADADFAYSGFTASAGVTADLGEFARVAGAVSFGGDLEASPSDGTDGAGNTVPMPVELRLGGTAVLAPQLSLMAGISWADWADAGAALAEVDGGTVLRLGGGIEWSGARILGKPSQLRVGYRNNDLPFRRAGDPAISESVWSGGVGIDLVAGQAAALARADLSLERGSRDAGSVVEDFWRFGVTVRVSSP